MHSKMQTPGVVRRSISIIRRFVFLGKGETSRREISRIPIYLSEMDEGALTVRRLLFFVRTLAFRLSRFIKLDAAILGTTICSVVGRNRVAVAIPLGREIAGLVASGIYVTSKNMAPFEGAMSCLLHFVTIFRWLRKCPLHPCRCRYTSSPCRISVCGDAYRAITLQHESHRLRQADDPAQSRRRAD